MLKADTILDNNDYNTDQSIVFKSTVESYDKNDDYARDETVPTNLEQAGKLGHGKQKDSLSSAASCPNYKLQRIHKQLNTTI